MEKRTIAFGLGIFGGFLSMILPFFNPNYSSLIGSLLVFASVVSIIGAFLVKILQNQKIGGYLMLSCAIAYYFLPLLDNHDGIIVTIATLISNLIFLFPLYSAAWIAISNEK